MPKLLQFFCARQPASLCFHFVKAYRTKFIELLMGGNLHFPNKSSVIFIFAFINARISIKHCRGGESILGPPAFVGGALEMCYKVPFFMPSAARKSFSS